MHGLRCELVKLYTYSNCRARLYSSFYVHVCASASASASDIRARFRGNQQCNKTDVRYHCGLFFGQQDFFFKRGNPWIHGEVACLTKKTRL